MAAPVRGSPAQSCCFQQSAQVVRSWTRELPQVLRPPPADWRPHTPQACACSWLRDRRAVCFPVLAVREPLPQHVDMMSIPSCACRQAGTRASAALAIQGAQRVPLHVRQCQHPARLALHRPLKVHASMRVACRPDAPAWRWEASEDAQWAYGAFFALLAAGQVPALQATRLADLPYFMGLATLTIYIGAHRGLASKARQQISLRQARSRAAAQAATVTCQGSGYRVEPQSRGLASKARQQVSLRHA